MTAEKIKPEMTSTTALKNTRRLPTDIQRMTSDRLLGQHGELIIEHAGRDYRLRKTSTGKLILTA